MSTYYSITKFSQAVLDQIPEASECILFFNSKDITNSTKFDQTTFMPFVLFIKSTKQTKYDYNEIQKLFGTNGTVKISMNLTRDKKMDSRSKFHKVTIDLSNEKIFRDTKNNKEIIYYSWKLAKFDSESIRKAYDDAFKVEEEIDCFFDDSNI